MNDFNKKYPAITSLILIIATFAKNLAEPGESTIQKLEGEITLLPQLLTFLPQAGGVGQEIAALRSSPADIASGVEMLVTDLAFTSAKAQSIINAAFPVAQQLAAFIPSCIALEKAIKA